MQNYTLKKIADNAILFIKLKKKLNIILHNIINVIFI